jgi:hypothetical protein
MKLMSVKSIKKERLRQQFESAFNPTQAVMLADVIVEEYDELVKTSDFNELKSIVRELGEDQKGIKKTLIELAEDQKEMKKAIIELAEAQKKTEVEIRNLAYKQDKTSKEVGGLSIAFGFHLENEAYKALPKLLKQDYGITVNTTLTRLYVKDKQGKDIEVNIVGEAERNGKIVMIIGEAKSQLSNNGINDFIRKKLNRLEGVYEEIFPIMVTHMTTGFDVEAYAKSKGIALYYSYNF